MSHQRRFDFDELNPCCHIRKTVNYRNSPDDVKTYEDWLQSITNWVPECNHCRMQELKQVLSPRQRSLVNPIYTNIGDRDIVSLEVQIDRECNAACLMCNEGNSTTWEQYNKKTLKTFVIDKQDNLVAAKARFNVIKETTDFSKLKLIVFLGGEPFRSKVPLDMLNEIKKVRNLAELSVRFVTNGSTLPDPELLKVLSEVQKVSIALSIDGIDEHFNYLRWPLQWNQVEPNIQYFVDLDVNKNYELRCSHIVSTLNMFYHDRYVAWADKFFKGTKVRNFFTEPLPVGGELSLMAMPRSLVDEIRIKYRDFAFAKSSYTILNMISNFDSRAYDNFMEHVTKHDTYRKTNFREVFPEIQHHFK